MLVKEMVVQQIEELSEPKLRQVAEFLAFLNFRERLSSAKIFDADEVAKTPSLEELLAGITEENIHREIDFGPAVGKEVW